MSSKRYVFLFLDKIVPSDDIIQERNVEIAFHGAFVVALEHEVDVVIRLSGDGIQKVVMRGAQVRRAKAMQHKIKHCDIIVPLPFQTGETEIIIR